MAALTFVEKNLLEKLFRMDGGYVLDFSNRTFAEFFADAVGIDIYEEKYTGAGDSKAKLLRAFWNEEDNFLVGKVLHELIQLVPDESDDLDRASLKVKCSAIATRLIGGNTVEDIAVLDEQSEEQTFRLLASSVRGSIADGNPEAALDRLHTYVVKFVRQVCKQRNIDTSENKALHGLMGEYVKVLKRDGLIQSDISERILKNSIGVMESFNHVRNRHSLAHDNDLLSSAESLLILNHIVSIIRFIQAIEP